MASRIDHPVPIPQSYTDSGEEWSDLTISYFSYLCGGVGEEQRCLQGALGCGVQKAQARALHGGGGEEQRRFQGALGGGGEEVQARALHGGGGEEQGCLQGALGGG